MTFRRLSRGSAIHMWRCIFFVKIFMLQLIAAYTIYWVKINVIGTLSCESSGNISKKTESFEFTLIGVAIVQIFTF